MVPDLLYARGGANSPTPDPTSFDKSTCSLLLIEVGFCSDLNLRTKLEEKTQKYQPLLEELRQHWVSVSLVCVPIGHAGTTLAETATHLAAALASRRPGLSGSKRKTTTGNETNIDRHALHHDTTLANRLLQQPTSTVRPRVHKTFANARTSTSRNTTTLPK